MTLKVEGKLAKTDEEGYSLDPGSNKSSKETNNETSEIEDPSRCPV